MCISIHQCLLFCCCFSDSLRMINSCKNARKVSFMVEILKIWWWHWLKLSENLCISKDSYYIILTGCQVLNLFLFEGICIQNLIVYTEVSVHFRLKSLNIFKKFPSKTSTLISQRKFELLVFKIIKETSNVGEQILVFRG